MLTPGRTGTFCFSFLEPAAVFSGASALWGGGYLPDFFKKFELDENFFRYLRV